MNGQIYSIDQIKKRLTPVFVKYPVKKAVLFGSYVRGQASEKSDIDILVDSGLRGLSFYGLLEDVVTQLDKPVDLLDISQLTEGSRIQSEIQREGIVIYEQ